jgi:hypothetical protein
MKNQQLLALWRGHIDSCRASGLRVTEYCKKHSLATRRYYYWKLRVERSAHIETKGKSGKPPISGQWLCVEPMVDAPPSARSQRAAVGPPDHLTVRVGGAEIDVRSGFNASLLRSVVQALGTHPC